MNEKNQKIHRKIEKLTRLNKNKNEFIFMLFPNSFTNSLID